MTSFYDEEWVFDDLIRIIKMAGRTPDFVLKGMNKKTDQKSGRLGVAWQNPDGSLTLELDFMIRLEQTDGMLFTLFPMDEAPARPAKRVQPAPMVAEAIGEVKLKPWAPPPPPPEGEKKPVKMSDLKPSVTHRVFPESDRRRKNHGPANNEPERRSKAD